MAVMFSIEPQAGWPQLSRPPDLDIESAVVPPHPHLHLLFRRMELDPNLVGRLAVHLHGVAGRRGRRTQSHLGGAVLDDYDTSFRRDSETGPSFGAAGGGGRRDPGGRGSRGGGGRRRGRGGRRRQRRPWRCVDRRTRRRPGISLARCRVDMGWSRPGQPRHQRTLSDPAVCRAECRPRQRRGEGGQPHPEGDQSEAHSSMVVDVRPEILNGTSRSSCRSKAEGPTPLRFP